MYIPKQFEVTDLSEIKKFVERVASADFVTTNSEGLPLATLMPCLWVEDGTEYGQLVMHMSRGNAQWKSITPGQLGLAIVHGVQAYISPNNYVAKQETGKVVPTWNYTSVHLSGKVSITEEPAEILEMVSTLTDHHEINETKPWQVTDAPADYISAQLRAIVGVTLKIEKVEAKAKLNQNRSSADRAGVISALENSDLDEVRQLAELMNTDDSSANRLT